MNAFMKWAASLLLVISLQFGLTGAGIHSDSLCSCRIPIRSGAVFPAVKISGDGNHIKTPFRQVILRFVQLIGAERRIEGKNH